MTTTVDVLKEYSSLRAAENKDAKRMAEVIIAAMDLSPHWTWRYPYRKQFPDVHRRETERVMASYVKKSKDGVCIALVAEVETEVEVEIEPPELTTEELLLGVPRKKKRKEKQKTKQIVGVAIAQLPGTFVEPMTRVLKAPESPSASNSSSTAKSSDSGRSPVSPISPTTPGFRSDGHPERAKAFSAEFGPAKKRYFDFPYGNSQLYIDFMAVHPDYHRRGIAQRLLDWLLELAKKEKEAQVVTLFATPMGAHLYRKAGFVEVGSVSVKLEDDTGEGAEGIVAPVLVWNRETHIRAELS